MDVKILTYTNTLSLERRIVEYYDYGYKLMGSVTTGINSNGNTIYLATMIKEQ
ncbi:hypothetical protein A71_177 [Escherichia phage A7_1]|nr:hypothetical protein A71_177 [Escherichia phage A7_1]